MSSLILHCGARQVGLSHPSLDTAPEPTETHRPLPHRWLIDNVQRRLTDHGYSFGNWKIGLGGTNDARMFATVDLKNVNYQDWQGCLGLRNSHDKKLPVQVAGGDRVLVCDNLCFSGTFMTFGKHTPNVIETVLKRLDGFFGNLGTLFDDRQTFLNNLRSQPISTSQADHVIMEAARRDVIPWTDVKRVSNEWLYPTHREFQNQTMWTLRNAFTSEKVLGRRWNHAAMDGTDRTRVLDNLLQEVVA